MSHINNQVDKNNIDLVSCVQDLSSEQAATIQGGAALELYRDINFRNPLFFTDTGYRYVGNANNDQISSIRVNEGSWAFYTDRNFQGTRITLGPGAYLDARNLDVGNDSISSFRRVR